MNENEDADEGEEEEAIFGCPSPSAHFRSIITGFSFFFVIVVAYC
jgi:hypothetical protein